jgi:hypothetical protein
MPLVCRFESLSLVNQMQQFGGYDRKAMVAKYVYF